MKRIIVASIVVLAFAACGGNDSKESKEEKKDNATAGSDPSSNPDYQKGLDLISKSNCLTCHKIDEPLTGPPYKDVAAKYAGGGDSVINYLADKIRNGGSGVWGQVPMTPHPEVPIEDAKAMVKYILLLKK